MRRYALCALLAVSLVVTAAPGALANDAGHTYEYDDAIEVPPSWAGAYMTTQAHDYHVPVDEGAQITATLTWEEDATQDMDLRILGPSDACQLFPPEVFCLADLTASLIDRADCDGATEPRGPTTTTAQASVVADQTGTWIVHAAATLAQPADTVPYELSFTVSDAHGDVIGPQEQGYISSTGHCSTVE